jgi:hypothetical protein
MKARMTIAVATLLVALPGIVVAQRVFDPFAPRGATGTVTSPGVVSLDSAAAQGTPGTTPDAATTTPAVLDIVEVSQAVPAGTAATTVFTPQAGTLLVVTDVLLTNPNTAPVCGADLARTGAAIAGGLCVPAQTSLQIPLVTGVEFTDVAPLQLVGATDGTAPVRFHVRGFLAAVTQTPTPGTPTPPTTPGTPPTSGTSSTATTPVR